ncbi:MAG: class I SAM-dependent methyltransferase [bacterium]|nr:class I SAM-dependent methyltransferase [bacterium]
MSEENYESEWWGIVYDQWNERGGRRNVHEREFQFYRDQLQHIKGPILEASCGTGSILLRLAKLGHSIWGFDISEEMLAQLRQKASEQEVHEVIPRVSQQTFVNFKYEQRFAAILVPASAFMLISTQEEQIACLKNIHAHLEPGGHLLLNFYIPSLDKDLLKNLRHPLVEEEFGEFEHPQTGLPIEVTHKTRIDLGEQRETIYWVFAYDGKRHEVPLHSRWIYKDEFQLLLRLAGFSEWQVYGSHDGAPYAGSSDLTTPYWVVQK